MNRKKILVITGLIALVAVIGLGAFTFYTVRAQATPSDPPWDGNRPFAGRVSRGAGFGVSDEALAQALGISVAELQSARQKAAEAALKQAVEQGLITEKQAEWFQSDSGRFPFGNRLFAWLNQNGIDLNGLLAEALGISVEELNEARQKAVEIAIDQAVANGKLTQEQADLMKARQALFSNQNFINAMRAAFEAAVKKAVEEGVITKAQADLLLQQRQLRPDWQGMPGFPPPFSGQGGQFPPLNPPGDVPPAPAP